MRDQYDPEDFPAGLRRRYQWRARWYLFTRPRVRPAFAYALHIALGLPLGWWSVAVWEAPWLLLVWVAFVWWTGGLLWPLVAGPRRGLGREEGPEGRRR